MAANVLVKQDESGPQGDVDLYAGVDEFGSAANPNEGPEAAYSADLYEDVIHQQGIPGANGQEQLMGEGVPGGKEYKSYTTLHPKSALQQEKEAKIAASLYSKSNDKGKALYVGNLTWWTTDEELAGAIQGCGVTDLINIKFFENRANGQSKGYVKL